MRIRFWKPVPLEISGAWALISFMMILSALA